MPFPDMTKFARLLLALSLAIAAGTVSAQERPHRAPPSQPAEQRATEQRTAEPRESVLRLLPPDAVTGRLAVSAPLAT
jgi:hypothetical protein